MFLIPIRDSVASRRPPIVNWAIIAANVAVFFAEISMPRQGARDFILQWALYPANLHPATADFGTFLSSSPTLLSSLFLHAGPSHLIGNMLFLYIFGDNVEDRLGHLRYLAFYLACGACASAAHVVFSPAAALGVPTLGASGAIGGVMGAYMISYPRAYVQTFIWLIITVRFVWVPAVFYLGFWFVQDLLMALMSTASGGVGGVAFWAHVGGFVAGMGLVSLRAKPPTARHPRFPQQDRPSVVIIQPRRRL